MQTNRRRHAALLFALFPIVLGSCASRPAPPRRPAPKVTACHEIPAVQTYLEGVASQARDEFVGSIEGPADERATVSIKLDRTGKLVGRKVVRASSAEAAARAIRSVELGGPYPAPPAAYSRCFRGPLMLVLVADVPVDCNLDEGVTSYVDSLVDAILDELAGPAHRSSPGSGHIIVAVRVASDGVIRDVSFPAGSNPLVSAKVSAALDDMPPLAPPPHYDTCFAREPVRMLLQVEGR